MTLYIVQEHYPLEQGDPEGKIISVHRTREGAERKIAEQKAARPHITGRIEFDIEERELED